MKQQNVAVYPDTGQSEVEGSQSVHRSNRYSTVMNYPSQTSKRLNIMP